MPDKFYPNPSPDVVLREESDDWAILYNPNDGGTFGLDPVSVFIWRHIDGKHTRDEILAEMKEAVNDVPPEAGDHLDAFLKDLEKNGLIGYK